MPRNTPHPPLAARGDNRRLPALLAAGVLLIAAAHLAPARLGVVWGDSMTPTLLPGQPFLYAPQSAAAPPPARGAVVLLRLGGQLCVKRVLARGGEGFWTISPRSQPGTNCRLLAVGAAVAPWRRRWPEFHFQRIDVPRGHVFVIGDGANSVDSRTFGSVPLAAVVGRVLLPEGEPDREQALVAWSEPPPRPRRGGRSGGGRI